ncbi:hypothetical protein LH61_03860 [Leuconostoc mesenteroides P45]|uniref:AraC family transcriptional regulator n=1 Tax=Leuconostoc mesenteroides TaxID=1245 RepID=UPI000508972C|nr:AraC family transcriptional regulator [Leuconostoc mesenteroides]KGB50660.1 hypothetical protein LH61_03860 [Leuconostoc mesenteroides P45]
MKSFEKKELQGSIRLPALDWNISFFGGHQQDIKSGWHYPSERHLAFEVFYIVEGAINVTAFDNTIRLESGDIMVLYPNVWHETTSLIDTTYFNFHFNLDDERFVTNLINQGILNFPNGSLKNITLIKSLDKLRNVLNKNMAYTFKDELKLQVLLSDFIFQLFSSEILEHTPLNSSQLKIASSIAYGIRTTLQKNIHSYFNVSNHSSRLSIDKIYSDLKISPSYGGEVFKKIYGYAPRQYLTKLKIAQAKRLLQMPDLSVIDISEALGYRDPAHFSRQFKKWTENTPYQYRKSHQ